MDSTGGQDLKAAGGDDPAVRSWRAGRRVGVGAILIGLAAAGPASAGALPAPACLGGGEPAQVATVGPALDFGLADGRTVQLAGVDPVGTEAPGTALAARSAMERWLVGHTVDVRPLASEPDRWGRVPALIFAAGDAANGGTAAGVKVSVAEALIDAGFARARPDVRTAPCWTEFLGLERGARTAGLGLWREPRYAVIRAEDRARLLAATGRMAIVEGRIVRIVEGRARMYLAFGTDGRADFAVTIAKPALARLRAEGSDPAGWRGRPLRVRGLLDDRFGLQIELTSTDQIEFTEPL